MRAWRANSSFSSHAGATKYTSSNSTNASPSTSSVRRLKLRRGAGAFNSAARLAELARHRAAGERVIAGPRAFEHVQRPLPVFRRLRQLFVQRQHELAA